MKYFSYILIFLTLTSCSEFQKVVKSEDMDFKYNSAVEYFNNKDYYRAGILFEEIIPLFRGRKESELATYYYAYCHYNQDQLSLASFYFQTFVRTYPRSEKVEECSFMNVKALYLSTPAYNLEQSTTMEAINSIQSFVNRYSNSKYLSECNKMIDELNAKLERKDYENAKLYHKLRYYKSAVISLQNFVNKYPSSKFAEEMLFLKTESQFEYAKMSIDDKQKERFMQVVDFYKGFLDAFPNGVYVKKAENIYGQTISELEKIEKLNKQTK